MSIQDDKSADLPAAIEWAITELPSELEFLKLWSEAEEDLELAQAAFLTGSLARVCEEKVGTFFAMVIEARQFDFDFRRPYRFPWFLC